MVRAILCLVAFSLLPQTISAQPARDTSAPARGAAVIRGRVLDAATKRGLSRVEVRAIGFVLRGTARAALTDGDGRYEIGELPAGTYTVAASKPNYVPTSWGQTRPQGPATPVTLNDAQPAASIDFSLTRAGVITGKIVDEYGDPVTGVNVVAMRYQYIQGARRLAQAGRSRPTNDIGEYRVYGLPPGQYYVSATLRNPSFGADQTDRAGYAPIYYPGTPNVADAQRMAVAAGQTIPSINLTLLPVVTSRITGSVIDADGKPASGVAMLMQRLGAVMMNDIAASLTIDGTFTLAGVPPGEYDLRVNSPGGSQESASTAVTVSGDDINDLQLVMAKPSRIRGRIVFTGGGASATPRCRPSTSAPSVSGRSASRSGTRRR